MADKNWIKDAIKNPGALTKKAKKAKAMTKKGTIKKGFIEKETKSDNPTTRKQANLAKTLAKLRG